MKFCKDCDSCYSEIPNPLAHVSVGHLPTKLPRSEWLCMSLNAQKHKDRLTGQYPTCEAMRGEDYCFEGSWFKPKEQDE